MTICIKVLVSTFII